MLIGAKGGGREEGGGHGGDKEGDVTRLIGCQVLMSCDKRVLCSEWWVIKAGERGSLRRLSGARARGF